MRNNIVIFITKVWYDCRNIKDTALCETGYYSTSGSNLIQIGVNTVFSGSAKQPTFFGFKFEFAALVQSMALLFFYRELSSVARGAGELSPPIGLPTKMQNKKNTTFFSTSKTLFCTGLD